MALHDLPTYGVTVEVGNCPFMNSMMHSAVSIGELNHVKRYIVIIVPYLPSSCICSSSLSYMLWHFPKSWNALLNLLAMSCAEVWREGYSASAVDVTDPHRVSMFSS